MAIVQGKASSLISAGLTRKALQPQPQLSPLVGEAVETQLRHWPRNFGTTQHGERAAIPTYKCSISYSITSSAIASSLAGMSKPSVFAVLRLITSWNLVGCTTGKSAGLIPLRIFAT